MNEAQSAADSDAPTETNFHDGVLPSGGCLSMGVVENYKTNEARSDEDYVVVAPVSPNFLNYALPSSVSLSMGFVENTKMNEAWAAADATVPEAAATSNAQDEAATPNAPEVAATEYALVAADASDATV